MIGRQKTYRVELTEDEKKLLRQQALALKTGQSKVRLAKLILKVNENPDWTNAQIAGEIGFSSGIVRKWRKRWCQTLSLEEAPPSGRPFLFRAIVKAQVTCSLIANQRILISRWRGGVVSILRHI